MDSLGADDLDYQFHLGLQGSWHAEFPRFGTLPIDCSQKRGAIASLFSLPKKENAFWSHGAKPASFANPWLRSDYHEQTNHNE